VLDFTGKSAITAADLEAAPVQPGIGKLLFLTDNSRLWDHPVHAFREDFCALTLGACQWVVDQGIHLVGIDYLSIQCYEDSFDSHVVLLSAEVVILEGLDLRNAAPGIYKLSCLPIKVKGVEGMMARAVLETV
jgi:arylformamidase